MKNYEFFCIVDKSKSGLILQISKFILRLKNNPNQQLSYFLPEIPPGIGIRLIILITNVKTLDQKLKKTIKILESNDSIRFFPNEKIFITNHNLKPGKTVFLFPGFGSEFPEMLTGTSSKFKVVSKWMNIFEDFYNRTDKNNSISKDEWLESLLVKKNYGVTEIGPIGSIASLAFNDILHTLNIKCDAMIGHSNGENAALISSGILKFNSKDKILKTLQLLSEFPQLKNKNGVYLAVNNFSKKNIDELLYQYPNDVFLAMNNCPGQQVVFAKLDSRESVIEFIKKRYGLVFELTTDHPYHTKEFEVSLDYIKPIYSQLQIIKGIIPIPVYSCVNAKLFPDDDEGIRDLALRQWIEPVDFQKTIKTAYEEGARTFIEVGPNNRLSGFVLDSLKGKNILMVNCSKENTSALDMIIEMCAKLWVNNHTVDLSYFTKNIEFTLVDNGVATDSKFIRNSEKIFEAHQELMQQFLKLNDTVTKSFLNKLNAVPEPIENTSLIIEINDLLLNGKYKKTNSGLEFIGTLDISKQKLINDHSMGGELPVVPFTVSLELLAEIGTQLIESNNGCLSVFDSSGNQWLDFERSIIELKITANLEVSDEGEKIVDIKVYNVTDKMDSKIPAFQGKVKSIINVNKASIIELGETKNSATISMSDFYKDHLFHGTCFKSMHRINYWNNQGVEATFKMPDLSNAIEGISSPEFRIPGPMLDGTAQLMAYWLYEQGMRDYAIFPFYLGSFDQNINFPSAGNLIQCRAKISKESFIITSNFEFIDSNGNCIGRLNNFRLKMFNHEWIPPLLMNRLSDGNPETLTAEFLNEGGGIWKKILGKLKLKNEEYDHWFKSSNSDQIKYLLELETFKLSSIKY
jgi:malonyl CoA-acyl carrier protein transacylase